MEQIFKKYLLMLLTAVLVFPAWAGTSNTNWCDFSVNGIHYKITGSTDVYVTYNYLQRETDTRGYYIISESYVSSMSGDISIPEYVYYNGTSYHVIGIYEKAFYENRNVTSVSMPRSITWIGNGAFYGSGIKSIVIPSSVTSYGSSVFEGCPSLQYAYINSKNCPSFKGCTNLQTVTFGQTDAINGSVISGDVFAGCTRLQTVNIGDFVTSLDCQAFSGCNNLTTLIVGGSLQTVTNVMYMPSSLQYISVSRGGNNRYFDCDSGYGQENYMNMLIETSTRKIVLGTQNYRKDYGCRSVGAYAFQGRACNQMSIDCSETIENYAFSNCNNIEVLQISSSFNAPTIGNYAFSGCSSLKHIVVDYQRSGDVPAISENVFPTAVYQSAKLHIANSSTKDAYLSTAAWNKFSTIDNFYEVGRSSHMLMNKTTASLKLEETTTLTATPMYNNTTPLSFSEVVWSSSDPSIATVDQNGLVRAVAGGRVTISATKKYGLALVGTCVVNVLREREIKDADPVFTNATEIQYDELTYTRNFKNKTLQALFVPFAMSYDDWKDNFTVYAIDNVTAYDSDDDEVLDALYLYIDKITNGRLKPNHPYLIKANNPGEQTITVNNATLYRSEDKDVVDCMTTRTRFTFQGIYAPTAIGTSSYAFSSGSLKRPNDESVLLGAFRWYMTVEDRGSQWDVPALNPAEVKVMIIGEDEEEETTMAEIAGMQHTPKVYYSPFGTRSITPQKGINIVRMSDGSTRKVTIK